MARRLEVEIVGDASSLERALGKSSGGFSRFGRAAGKAALALGALAGGAIVFSVKAASDLGEQINKTTVVFGESSKQVHQWSKGLARSFGLSQRAALEAAGTYGNMLKPMGLAPALAAKMSMRMTELAGDMASFNNASPAETLDALRAGLAGETEPLRRFGIFLNDARLKQEAMSMGLYDGTGALDAAAKAQATYSLILKDSKDAQGDFARTQNSLPNLLRTFKASLENAAAAIGQVFLPIATAMLSWFAEILPKILEVVSGLVDHFKPAVEDIAGAVTQNMATIQATFQQVFDWVKTNVFPIIERLKAIFTEAVAAIAQVLAEKGPELQRIFARLGTAISAISEIVLPILKLWLVEILPRAIGTAIEVLDKMTAAIAGVAGVIKDAIQWLHGLWDWLVKITSKIWNIVVSIDLPDLPGGTSWRDFLRGSPVGPIIPRAAGGPVSAMTPYLVGERGPELFVPGRGGTIIPNGAGGRPFQVNLSLDGKTLAAVLIDPLRGEIKKVQRAGGTF